MPFARWGAATQRRKLTFLSLKLTFLSLRLTFLSLKLTCLSLKLTFLCLKLTCLSLKLTFIRVNQGDLRGVQDKALSREPREGQSSCGFSTPVRYVICPWIATVTQGQTRRL